ncbi:hypothetical protein P1X14_09445 [Sphingomonas sp. AOB5]|uniref:hypothetical protein n=1 Tax=Sphingomonas sp. AOB5 TaxID=3034017 RepID=UPI0023F9A5A7|nr:hypothetical protein [Sphingomonas sp. AOB5]MDF7775471.1 hypothetical protein [Sphingomonas sp. AOB5]
MARTTPFWLAAPTRFASFKRGHARIGIAIVLTLLLATLTALTVANPPELGAISGGERPQTDLMLYENIVAGIKGGGSYYAVAADALRAGDYPLRPFLTFRLPGLATILAALPPWAPQLLQLMLALTVAVTWMLRLRPALPRLAPMLAAAILLAGSLLAFAQPGLVAFHEIWAGLLVALSLGMRKPGRWIEPVAIALAAMLIRETAALYAIIMLAFAWLEGERREAIGWGIALAAFGAALGVHAYAVSGVTGPLDAMSPGWAGLQGFGLFVKSLTLATALQLLPLWAGALLVGLALTGWAAWNDPLGLRMIAILSAYALVIGIFARLDTFYWGLMVAPVFLLGLVFVPDAIRDLVTQSLDRKRITVTRVTR